MIRIYWIVTTLLCVVSLFYIFYPFSNAFVLNADLKDGQTDYYATREGRLADHQEFINNSPYEIYVNDTKASDGTYTSAHLTDVRVEQHSVFSFSSCNLLQFILFFSINANLDETEPRRFQYHHWEFFCHSAVSLVFSDFLSQNCLDQ